MVYRICRCALWKLGLLALAGLLVGCAGGVGSAAQVTPTLTAQERLGRRAFNEHCSTCHSTIPDSIIVGPSLAGVADRAGSRIPGMKAEEYLRMSIEHPGEYVVDGFSDLMPPNISDSLSEEEIDAVIAYLLSL